MENERGSTTGYGDPGGALVLGVGETAESISCYKEVLGKRERDKDVPGNLYSSRMCEVPLL